MADSIGIDHLLREFSDVLQVAPGPDAALALSPRDTSISIENKCKNALDDELTGFASQLFDAERGLPALVHRSLDIARGRNDKPRVELRLEALKLIIFLIDDHRAREREAHIAEYATKIVTACLRTFRLEIDSSVRAEIISTLLAVLDLRDFVPDLSELHALLFPPRDEHDPRRDPTPIDLFWSHLIEPVSRKGLSDTTQGRSLQLLGRLALLFPVHVIEWPIYEDGRLYRKCEGALRDESSGMPLVQGALECLDGLLCETRLTPKQARAPPATSPASSP